MREFGRQAMAFITRIGADPGDPVELRLRKALLVTVALMVLPAGVIWGALYWVAGEPTAALLPWTYFVGSLLGLAAFHLARSFVLLRRAQLLLILLVPFLLTLALGGLAASGGVSKAQAIRMMPGSSGVNRAATSGSWPATMSRSAPASAWIVSNASSISGRLVMIWTGWPVSTLR